MVALVFVRSTTALLSSFDAVNAFLRCCRSPGEPPDDEQIVGGWVQQGDEKARTAWIGIQDAELRMTNLEKSPNSRF
jgi:hypothetical protein